MAIVTAFVKIAGPKEALPVIVDLLDNNQRPGINRELVKLFLKLEKDPKQVVSILSKSLQHKSVEQKKGADGRGIPEIPNILL